MKGRQWTVLAVVIAAVMVVGLVAQPAAAGGPGGGQQAYDKQCAKCHGDDGAGKTKIGEKMGLKDLGSAEVQKLSDEEMTKITAEGKDKMPAFDKKLSKDEIKAVVAYMRTFKN